LGEETIKKVLIDSGLTEKETEVYIFLAKHNVCKGTEIARLLRKDKAQVFRILRRLQAKGYVEATFEFPSRFTVVPFENIIDTIVKAKQEEVAHIKESKKDLLDYMSLKRQTQVLEKFLVISGNRKIYSKISQIIKDTKHELSIAATFEDIIRGYRFGIFDDASDHPLRDNIQFRFLTDILAQDSKALKTLIAKMPQTDFDFKARNPELGLSLFPRMITRDNEELLFFTSRTVGKDEKGDVCLWTNCKSLVQTFTAVFDDLWRNSTDLQTKIAEHESVKSMRFEDFDNSEEKYWKALCEAEKEIVIMTSAKTVISFWERKPLLREWKKKGISVRIMAPITKENFKVAGQLSSVSEVRHVALSQMGTTIVDAKYLFQFKTPLIGQEEPNSVSPFKPQFYSDDLENVSKVKAMLDDLWIDAHALSPIVLDSILPPAPNNTHTYMADKADSAYRKIDFPIDSKPGATTEKEVLSKIINAKRHHIKDSFNENVVFYGKQAISVIHPPAYMNLPEMIIQVLSLNNKSSFGAENELLIYLQLDTIKGNAFVPVAYVQDRVMNLKFRQNFYANYPAGKNSQVFNGDEFQVQANGNNLFVGWTKPIPLLLGKYTLPPSCLLFEGYGKVKSGIINISLPPNGFTQKWEYNGLEAFVTFFHPLSKYSGLGTDGRLTRELVITGYPPNKTR
jgi:sugar-specific transcriptional regulator TrmB